MFWFFTHYEDKGKLGCPTLSEEKETKITLIALQSLQIFANLLYVPVILSESLAQAEYSLEHRSKIFLP